MHQPIRNGRGELLEHRFRAGRDAGGERRELVVIGVRGAPGGDEDRLAEVVATDLEADGVCSLRFAFAGCGRADGEPGEATVSKGVDDLRAVLDHCAGWRVAYLGHGLGAAAGLLCASGDPRLAALMSLAGVVDCAGFARRDAHAANVLSSAVADDLQSLGRLDQLAAAIRIPWLLVQAGADDVVPPADALGALAHAEHGNARLVVVPGADHGFRTPLARARLRDHLCGFLAAAWAA